MIYPIVAYGDPVLRQQAAKIAPHTDVTALVAAMFATMDQAGGVGLAAPQIGQSIRLFVVDYNPFVAEGAQSSQHRKVYINPALDLDYTEELQYYDEGCLSIPGVLVQVPRPKRLVVRFYDSNWKQQQEELVDMPARVIQHEYDHLNGKLHIDYASPLKLRLLQGKLTDIRKGAMTARYPMQFFSKKV